MRRSSYAITPAIFLAVLATSALPRAAQQRPDFSGHWKFDLQKSMKPGPDGRVILAPLFGDEFVATHDASTLTIKIKAGDTTVLAVYKLDGSESRNMSPGGAGQPDVAVLSRASWEGDRLIILSKSTSIEKGQEVTMETKRVLYLEDGDFVMERSGTPRAMVTTSRSVYKRAG